MGKDKIEQAVRKSISYRQAGKHLGVGNQTAKRMIEKLGIDVSHFDFGRRSIGYVGKKYNRLTIQEVFKEEKSGRWVCRCECECGVKDVVRRLDGVRSGQVPSCGCAYLNRPSMVGGWNPAFTGCGELQGSRVYWIKQGAERRSLQFSVSKEYLWRLFESQNRRCSLSGVELKFGRMNFSHETTASLDRIDSSKGYLEGNVQWVHKDVNKIKRDLNQAHFLRLCRLISDHTRDHLL